MIPLELNLMVHNLYVNVVGRLTLKKVLLKKLSNLTRIKDNMNYDLIVNYKQEEFIERVNEKIKKGWEPQGSISVVIMQISSDRHGMSHSNETVFSQAMIKKESE
jgi:hypothetical protein